MVVQVGLDWGLHCLLLLCWRVLLVGWHCLLLLAEQCFPLAHWRSLLAHWRFLLAHWLLHPQVSFPQYLTSLLKAKQVYRPLTLLLLRRLEILLLLQLIALVVRGTALFYVVAFVVVQLDRWPKAFTRTGSC